MDCVHEGSRTTRRATTVFGGRPSRTAIVTYTLIALNVLLYIVERVKPGLATDWEVFGYATTTPGGPLQGVAAGEWYRLLTSAFLPPTGNVGILDIVFNMWALVVVGPALEQLLGRGRFLTLYLLSAIGGAVAYFLLAAPNAPALGASGAIYGLFGAWFVVSRRLRLDTRGILVLIAVNLAFSFSFSGSIAWQDHIGGLITGVLVTAAFAYAPRKGRLLVQAAAAVAILAILVVIVMLRSHDLTSQIAQAAGF